MHISTLADLAAQIPDGASIALAKEPMSPMALAHALIRRNAKDLTLITVPTAAIIADVLIGAGCVADVETSGISLGEFGPAGRFVDAVKTGRIVLRDSTCPAVYAALQASEKGQPFVPIRGLIGSDLLASRSDLKEITNPFAPNDTLVVLPALRPDFALIHAELCDADGNLYIGGRHELKSMAHASTQVIATAERMIEGSLLDDPLRAPNCINAMYVAGLSVVEGGAWPTAVPRGAELDRTHLTLYAQASRSAEGFAQYLEDFVFCTKVPAQ